MGQVCFECRADLDQKGLELCVLRTPDQRVVNRIQNVTVPGHLIIIVGSVERAALFDFQMLQVGIAPAGEVIFGPTCYRKPRRELKPRPTLH